MSHYWKEYGLELVSKKKEKWDEFSVTKDIQSR